METSYKTGVLWVAALQAVLANEALRMEAILAIVNPWDIPDPVERETLYGTPYRTGRSVGLGRAGPCGDALQDQGAVGLCPPSGFGQRGLEDGSHLGHHQPLGHP